MPVSSCRRSGKTNVQVSGQCRYLYRAVDKAGRTVDFLLTAYSNRVAAPRVRRKAIGLNGIPSVVKIGKSEANQAGIKALYSAPEAGAVLLVIRQCKI